jgi:hypothetical protein
MADLVPSKQFQQIFTDPVHKALEYKKEREKLMEAYRQQNPGIMTDRQNITFIPKRLKHFSGNITETEEEYSKRCISTVLCTSAKVALGVIK